MIETIHVGMSGLSSFSRGLRVIANNTANMNTPGFKSSSLKFADAFYASAANGGRSSVLGYGVATHGTTLSFKPGELRQTGNSLDLALDGQGLFMLRSPEGRITYTRAGQFQFDKSGVLVNRDTHAQVMGTTEDGRMTEISIANQRIASGRPTSVVKFMGNLSSTANEQLVQGVRVLDSSGVEHLLTAKFTRTDGASPGAWHLQLLDGTEEIGTHSLQFENGRPTSGSSKPTFSYKPAGQSVQSITLDFSADVTSYGSGSLSTLAFSSQDGQVPAELTSMAFDQSGVLIMTYGNGQTVRGPRLLLGRFDTTDAVGSLGDNQFEALDGDAWHWGAAGGVFGAVRSGYVEISNVDLSQEFSDLIILQRGYQANSQVITSANEMLQELFSMKGR